MVYKVQLCCLLWIQFPLIFIRKHPHCLLPFFSLDSCPSALKHGAQSAAHTPPLAQTRNREAAFRRLCSTLTMRPHPRTWPADFSNGVQTSKGVDELKSHVEGTTYKSDTVGPHGASGQIRKPSTVLHRRQLAKLPSRKGFSSWNVRTRQLGIS